MFNGGLSKVRHTADVSYNVDSMIDRLVEAVELENQNLELMVSMSMVESIKAHRELVIDTVFKPVVEDASEDGRNRAIARREKGIAILNNCIDADFSIHGDTLWGLFNGVTRYFTHHRGGMPFSDKKAAYNMIGNGSSVTNKVFELLTKNEL
jgi:hypothetical protein